jgi:hypothetical protein
MHIKNLKKKIWRVLRFLDGLMDPLLKETLHEKTTDSEHIPCQPVTLGTRTTRSVRVPSVTGWHGMLVKRSGIWSYKKLGLGIPYNNSKYYGLKIHSWPAMVDRFETPQTYPQKWLKIPENFLSFFLNFFWNSFLLLK